MPPPPAAYLDTFTVNSVVYGFDIRQNGYSEVTQANLTIRAVPWSGAYTIIVQGAASTGGAAVGSKAVTRTYRAVVYTETDYLLLRGQRGQIGLLFTVREPGPGTGYQAVLTDCKRAELQDINTPTGAQTIEVGFTMLQ